MFPEGVDQDEVKLRQLSQDLSQMLHRPVVAFIVHDSDIFLYWLFDGGEELDRYNSAPGYFEGGRRKPEGGDAQILKRYCAASVSIQQLQHLLHGSEASRQGSAKMAKPTNSAKEMLIKKLRETYPSLVARQPNLPSLEQLIAEAEKRFADLPEIPIPDESFLFAEDRARELGKCLAVGEGRAVDSFQYLQQGEGVLESLLLVDADGVKAANVGVPKR